MIDKERFKIALESYKKDFHIVVHCYDSAYGSLLDRGSINKWKTVKHFQDNWNIYAENFSEMIDKSLHWVYLSYKTIDLAAIEFIKKVAQNNPEELREKFVALFDESNSQANDYEDAANRMLDFENCIAKYSLDFAKKVKKLTDICILSNGIHTLETVSYYLWLRYPDKYCPYRFRHTKWLDFLKEYRTVNLDYLVILSLNKDSPYNDKKKVIASYYNYIDELNFELKKDSELVSLLNSELTEYCYSDPNLKILTYDFLCYVQKNYKTLEQKIEKQIYQNTKVFNLTKENFLLEVFISEEKYNKIIATLERKKNIILQGAPGVGKTFAAKRLAYSIIGEKNDFQIEFVQFHQNYSYEDFVIGWRPAGNNFELRTGIFYDFCRKAALNPDKEFFFIIDEINRGNLSKIFGELLMLIESDHRGEKIKIPANGEDFFVPENLYIIGMMNTADRSLALIDYALRRRFSFINFEPAFDSEGFKTYQKNLQNNIFDKLIEQIKILNKEISEDKSLGKSFCIGHSYFCNFETCDENILRSIVDYEILPMLEEYFFDNEEKFQNWTENLHEVFK